MKSNPIGLAVTPSCGYFGAIFPSGKKNRFIESPFSFDARFMNDRDRVINFK